jgi:hypothetical protein
VTALGRTSFGEDEVDDEEHEFRCCDSEHEGEVAFHLDVGDARYGLCEFEVKSGKTIIGVQLSMVHGMND